MILWGAMGGGEEAACDDDGPVVYTMDSAAALVIRREGEMPGRGLGLATGDPLVG